MGTPIVKEIIFGKSIPDIVVYVQSAATRKTHGLNSLLLKLPDQILSTNAP